MGKNYTATYEECIKYYYQLEEHYQGIRVMEMGETDSGFPLHLVLLNAENNFNPKTWKRKKQVVLLINNGIHPGEPDGIDASMMLARDIVQKIAAGEFSKQVSLAIIPVYNIGGALNRSANFRVDQNGPDEFGSRGNAQNLDLNRDFIKCDSKEARSFATIFHYLQPTLFMDNHVSDGADYSYVMTLASTQSDKLGGVLGNYLHQKMEPALFESMKAKSFPMQYYVNAWSGDAANGWNQFFDSPRYSSGYAALFNTLSFVPETHMLKPYVQRVEATYQLMQTMIDYADQHHDGLIALIQQADENVQKQDRFPVSWSLDESIVDSITYAGYRYEQKISDVSGLPFSVYNKAAPFERNIPFHNHYKTQYEIIAPEAYIIPQGWYKVIDLLKLNRINMTPLETDTTLNVQVYYIRGYQSSEKPYEGHHANHDVQVEMKEEKLLFRKGDMLIPLNQHGKRFLIETLEPQGMDSYFTWNFFDPILNQKEGFTPYAFEAIASKYLNDHPEIRKKLEAKKLDDKKFASDTQQQLEFVYKLSEYAEPAYQRYPVYRVSTSGNAELLQEKLPRNKTDE